VGEEFYLNKPIAAGMELASELPSDSYDTDFDREIKTSGRQIRERYDRIKTYAEYQVTLLEAIEDDRIPSHLFIESEEEMWAQVDRASGIIAEDWDSLQKEVEKLETRMQELEDDWDRVSERERGEAEFLEKYGLDETDEWYRMIWRYDVLREEAVETGEVIENLDEKLPEKVSQELPDEVSIGGIVSD
jgi:DNA-binding transcriptional regulator GbsR (MarR family)